jgi:hypothetical protein
MGVELRPEVEERIASLLLPPAPKPAAAAQGRPRRRGE